MDHSTAYALPAELRTALLTYLMSRPYAEVAAGVQALSALEHVSGPTHEKQGEA